MKITSRRTPWTTCLRRRLELPWVELTVAVLCFHLALNNPGVIVPAGLASLGVILLARAVADIVKKRKSTHP